MYSFDLFREEGKVVPSDETDDVVNYMGAFQNAGILFFKGNFLVDFILLEATLWEDSGVKCDIILIDESHTTHGTFVDFRNFRTLAHKDSIVFIDDLAIRLAQQG